MGSSHATSGLLVGALTVPVAPVTGVVGTLAWVAAWGGFALLPDVDSKASKAASLWGPLTRVPAVGVARIARGHRAGTHDIVVAPLVAAAVFFVASLNVVAAGVVLALAIGLALVSVDPVLPGDQQNPLANLLVAAGLAWAAVAVGVPLGWLPIAAAGGVAVHIVGDSLTSNGVPSPLSTWRGRRSSWGPRLFATGSSTENLVAGCLWLGLAVSVWVLVSSASFDMPAVPTMEEGWSWFTWVWDRLPEQGFM